MASIIRARGLVRTGGSRFVPAATNAVKHAYVSKRFNEGGSNADYMVWPFDKYKMPAAAKKWLSKYPGGKDDGFEEEYVYLDEIEDRISNHYKTQRLGQRYRDALNEYAVMGDYDDVDKTYPVMKQDLTWGRGNKINPAHYVNAQFLTSGRLKHTNDKITPRHLLRNKGTVGLMQSLPPESPSLFKFWNFWHMCGAAFIVTVGKEWLILSSHDTHHYMMFFLVCGWFSGLLCDLFLWWKCLRGQEYYDQRFFPLQENVDNLFTLLDRLEKKPDMGAILGKYHGYVDTLRERLVTKRVAETVALKAQAVNDAMEDKYRNEQASVGKPGKQWIADAYGQTVDFFGSKAEQDKYFKSALAALKAKDGAKFGAAKNSSTAVQDKYAELLKATEKKWYDEQRKAGTLPWTHASDAEKKKAAMSEADKKALYDSIIKDLSSKYHSFA